MPTDVKETVTRKLGPLPVWGWAIAVAGAVFVARMVRGGSGGGGTPAVTAGSPQVVGGPGLTDVSGGPDLSALQAEIAQLEARLETTADATDILALQDQLDAAKEALEAAQSTITNQEGTIAGLSGTVGNLSQYQTLSTQLTTKLQQYSAALANVEKYRTLKRTAPTAAKKAEYDALMDKYAAQAKTLLVDITKLREQISKIGAT